MTIGRFYASAAAMAAALGGISFPVTDLLAAAGKVEVEVTGTIKPFCANSITAVPVNTGDPRKAGSTKFAFTVDCNAPFQYTMQSDNGALRLTNAPDAVSRDQIEVAYNVHIRIPLTLGGLISMARAMSLVLARPPLRVRYRIVSRYSSAIFFLTLIFPFIRCT